MSYRNNSNIYLAITSIVTFDYKKISNKLIENPFYSVINFVGKENKQERLHVIR